MHLPELNPLGLSLVGLVGWLQYKYIRTTDISGISTAISPSLNLDTLAFTNFDIQTFSYLFLNGRLALPVKIIKFLHIHIGLIGCEQLILCCL